VLVGFSTSDSNQGAIIVSANGDSWFLVQNLNFGALYAVDWSSKFGAFAAVGNDAYGPVVYTSENGLEWRKQNLAPTTPVNFGLKDVKWSANDKGCFIAIGGHKTMENYLVWTRSCGTASNWTINTRLFAGTSQFTSLAVSDQLNVAIATAPSMGSTGMIVFSFDNGLTWQSATFSLPDLQFLLIDWSPKIRRFVAVCVDTATGAIQIASSSNNNHLGWTVTYSANFGFHNVGLYWNVDLGLFLVAGSDGSFSFLLTSSDGVFWTEQLPSYDIYSSVGVLISSPTLSKIIAAGSLNNGNGVVFSGSFFYETKGLIARYTSDGALKWSTEYGNQPPILPSNVFIHQSTLVSVIGSWMSIYNTFQVFITRFTFAAGAEDTTFSWPLAEDAHYFIQDSAIEAADDLVIAVGYSISPIQVSSNNFTVGQNQAKPFVIRCSPSVPSIRDSIEPKISDQMIFATIQLNTSSRKALVLSTTERNSSWSAHLFSYDSVNSITSLLTNNATILLAANKPTNFWTAALTFGPAMSAFYSVRAEQSGEIRVSFIKSSDNGSIQSGREFSIDGVSSEELNVALTFSDLPVLAIAGRFGGNCAILLVNGTEPPIMNLTTERPSTETITGNVPIKKPQLHSQLIFYIITGAVVLAFILISGLLVYWILVKKRRKMAKQLELKLRSEEILTRSLASFRTGNAMEMAYISNGGQILKQTTTIQTISSIDSPMSVGNSIASHSAGGTNTYGKSSGVSGADAANNSTLFTSRHQGLYVPGHYLLNANTAIYQPIKQIYFNKNCEVLSAQALDRDLRKRCRNGTIAVKMMQKINSYFVESFYQEISILYFFVGKPNIVQLVGFCNSPYQIMTDFYSLGNLEESLLCRCFIMPTKKVILSFSKQIAGALALIHSNGFAHSDIKALNVFVDRDDSGDLQCYLGDFGVAQILDDSHLVVKAYRVLNLKGLTIPYAAPEVLRRFNTKDQAQATAGWHAGDFQRADAYAFGVLMYEILNCTTAWDWNSIRRNITS
jgi:hypothetical protein